MKFLKKQRIRNAEKAEDCSEIEEMELRLKMMKEHLTTFTAADRAAGLQGSILPRGHFYPYFRER